MQTPPRPQHSESDRIYPIIQQQHRHRRAQRSILIGASVLVAVVVAAALLTIYVFGVGQGAPTSRLDPNLADLGPTEIAQAQATQTAVALATPLPTVVVPPTAVAGAIPRWRSFFSWSAGASSTSGRFYIPPTAKAQLVWNCTPSDNLGGSLCVVELTHYLSAAEAGSTTGATQQISVADTQGDAHGSYTFASGGVYTVQAVIGIGDANSPGENFEAHVQVYQ